MRIRFGTTPMYNNSTTFRAGGLVEWGNLPFLPPDGAPPLARYIEVGCLV